MLLKLMVRVIIFATLLKSTLHTYSYPASVILTTLRVIWHSFNYFDVGQNLTEVCFSTV